MEQKSALEQKIIDKARAAAAGLLQKEQAQAAQVLESVKTEGAGALAEALSQAKQRGEMIQKEYVASAHLEAKLILLKKKDEIVERLLAAAWEQLKVRMKREDYKQVVRGLIAEGVKALGLKEARVTLGSSEKAAMSGSNADIPGVQLNVAPDPFLEGLGGVRVSDAQGHLMYDNSWEARLERLKPELILEISEILFSGSKGKQASPELSARQA